VTDPRSPEGDAHSTYGADSLRELAAKFSEDHHPRDHATYFELGLIPDLAVLCTDLADALRAWRRREVFNEGTYDLYPAADDALAAYDALGVG
jgi:hypothetical protein